jgi:phosphoglycolate phosphatase-like HAD superfamily hydrolase
MPGIHFLASQEVVKGANAVPCAPGGEVLVHEQLLDAGVIVLGRPSTLHWFPVGVHVLHPFALADRIEDQHHVAEARQSLAERLIGLDRLAVVRMAAGADDAREREGPAFGNVEIRRHQESWTALEDHVLDRVRVALDDLHDAGIQRRLLRERAKRLADSAADGLHIRFDVRLGRQRREPFQPLLIELVLAPDEEFLDHAREAIQRRERPRLRGTCGLHGGRGNWPAQRQADTAERERLERRPPRDTVCWNCSLFGHVHAIWSM